MDNETQVGPTFKLSDPKAFTEVYEYYHEAVRDRIKRCTSPNLQSEIDDICQHFWTELYKYINSYDPARPLENWLFSVCSRASASYYKAHARKRTVNLIGYTYSTLENFVPLDESPGPEECAILKEDAAAALAALDRIPPQFKRIIQAVYLKGVTPVDYAHQEGIALGTVYTQLNRGIEHLRKALTPALV